MAPVKCMPQGVAPKAPLLFWLGRKVTFFRYIFFSPCYYLFSKFYGLVHVLFSYFTPIARMEDS